MLSHLIVPLKACVKGREACFYETDSLSAGHLHTQQREYVQLDSLLPTPQLVSLWKIGEKFLYSSQYVNHKTGITVL